jgi:hypothetical protein
MITHEIHVCHESIFREQQNKLKEVSSKDTQVVCYASFGAQVLPIVKRHKIQLVLSGHDHNLQHIANATNINEVDYVISGAGGVPRYIYRPGSADYLISRGFVIRYFGYVHGFTGLTFTADQLTVQFIDSDGNVGHSFTRGLSTEP